MYDILLPTLSFPLNAYAQALLLAQGSVHALHYGFWEDGSDAVFADNTACSKAQAIASDVLYERLPPAPAKLLEVGIGLGGTAGVLMDKGYDYTGITPDNHQILYARHVLKPREPHFVHCPFESVPTGVQYDFILFQESAQYIHPATLLGQCYNLLRPGGQVLIMDEIPTPTVQAMPSQLGQYGFELKEQEDFTQRAEPSIRYLQAMIQQHREQVLYDLNVTAAQLNGLMHTLKVREQEYASGRHLYQFIRLQKV